MAGRYAKNSGATMKLADRTEAKQLRRFVPDFYVRSRPPVPQPNFRPRLNQTFGKRIVDSTAKSLVRRSPLAALGPLGDLLALGLITKDLYDLMMELQRQRHEMYIDGPLTPDYIGGGYDPANYDPAYISRTGTHDWSAVDVVYTGGPYGYGRSGSWYANQYQNQGSGASLHQATFVGSEVIWEVGQYTTYWDIGAARNKEGTTAWTSFDLTGLDLTLEDIWTGTYVPGVGIPLPWDIPLDWTEPDPNMKRDMFPDGKTLDPDMAPKPETEPEMKRARRFRKKVKLKERNVREGKWKGELSRVMNIADIASEGAEIVDAVYESLPPETRKHWEEMQGAHWAKYDGAWHWVIPSRGLLDSAGQYGIDGADWKARAIWHNWHKIDVDRAIKNIIRNEIQDRVLGGIAGASPANVGHTTDDANKQINKWLELFFEEVGL